MPTCPVFAHDGHLECHNRAIARQAEVGNRAELKGRLADNNLLLLGAHLRSRSCNALISGKGLHPQTGNALLYLDLFVTCAKSGHAQGLTKCAPPLRAEELLPPISGHDRGTESPLAANYLPCADIGASPERLSAGLFHRDTHVPQEL